MGITLPVVMISGWDDYQLAVRATRLGAVDFSGEKPLSTDKLLLTIDNVLKLTWLLEVENRELRPSGWARHEIVHSGDECAA